MAEKCEFCKKTVYAAEKKTDDGKIFHNLCHGQYIAKKQATDPKVFAIHEQLFCNPQENDKYEYPMKPKEEYLQKHFHHTCPGCSVKVSEGANFCTGCGYKLK
eukprot:gene6821-8460_t